MIVAVASAVTGVLLWRPVSQHGHGSVAPVPPARPLRPLPSWTIPSGALLVAVITWGAVWWLQHSLSTEQGPVERAQLQVEGLRAGLSVGAGVVAAFALLLAFRRQQLVERTQQAAEYDAGEKRVTELYVKAADQLGSEKAPVRLAGLYALERLAQDNPTHRQSIVEVVCAYLRMPYKPPSSELGSEASDATCALKSHKADVNLESAPHSAREVPTTAAEDDLRGERQVRIAAQRILARHLRPARTAGGPSPSYWGVIVLDLTEATLLDLDMTDCSMHDAIFDRAEFVGLALFNRTAFRGDVSFKGAQFNGLANFGQADFIGTSNFGGASFADSIFARATFGGRADFHQTTFTRGANFYDVRFLGEAVFAEADIQEGASFGNVEFHGDAWFERTKIEGGAWFDKAGFFAGAGFGGLQVARESVFREASFFDRAWFNHASFSKDASFNRAKFKADVWFDEAEFHDDASFCVVEFGGDMV
ncbi:pentapeptide repeat-containing protein [Micromonospora sp. CMU55-4]|nr:pentapeptide repeat-containing protein [Micromonospora sp. CMU55-4]